MFKQETDPAAAVQAAKSANLRTIGGGLNLAEGEYEFTTVAGVATGSFTTETGWFLTCVIGSCEGQTYDENSLFVVPLNDWADVKPGQVYIAKVNKKGYVQSFKLKA